MSKKVTITVEMSPWFQEILFAAGALLAAVENADDVLVTDEIIDAANELRGVIEKDSA